MTRQLASLEKLIGHTFKDIGLLERAVTHRSWAYESLMGSSEEEIRLAENESLEFVGDSVLGLVVAEQLFLRNPTVSEGDLTLMKRHLVSGSSLAALSEKLGLGEYIRLGGSEVKGGRAKRSLLTNTFEAIIGAVFVDGGYVVARSVIIRHMEEQLQNVKPETSVDFKSSLQAQLQAQRQRTAIYDLIKTDGPPHARKFSVEVAWEGGRAHGEGNSIKAAEMQAAERALEMLNPENKKPSKRAKKN